MGEMNKILRWVKAYDLLTDKKTLPTSDNDVHIQYNGGQDKETGSRTLITELIDSGWNDVEWLEETEPPYVNRLSEIVGKWPGDESAEEIIEGIKGEPQTTEGWVSGEELEKNHKEKYNFPPEPQNNEGVTEEMVNDALLRSQNYAKTVMEQFIEPLQNKLEFYRQQTGRLRQYVSDRKIGKPCQGLFDALYDYVTEQEAKISSLKKENEELKEAGKEALEAGDKLIAENRQLKRDLELYQKFEVKKKYYGKDIGRNENR